ncbi:putative glycolipid-binding domain-containing protein [Arthrobacter sp. UYCu712]|uniref:putative glycolipid-binding domain-containing protein n=1 Tax=Arthrobacter sp. UYCu712 TaxID=3156340 RepID=UPI0033919A0E
MTSLYAWRGTDDPERVDLASVSVTSDSMRAHGTSVTPSYASSWQLDVGLGWVTRSISVQVHGGQWSRSLLLEHAADGQWDAVTTSFGITGLPGPGLADPAILQDAIDCDLGLCPVTNTMPIRRLRLNEQAVPATNLVMAWIEMPSLRVLRSDQVYASDPAAAPGTVHYASASGDFQTDLVIDSDGIVIDYPHLARRVQIPG